MQILFRIFAIAAIVFVSVFARAEVRVARLFVTHVFQESVNIGAGQYWIYPLPGNTAGDNYRISIGTSNAVWKDLSAYVVDESNLAFLKNGAQFRAQGLTKGVTPFQFDATRARAEQLYLVLDNRYAKFITKKAAIGVKLATRIPEDAALKIEATFGRFYAGLKTKFEFPDFNINISPCGSVNALSAVETGDITLCSELFSQYARQPNVLAFVMAHEIGHTLLNRWGLPGGDNEDMADEFAAYVMLSGTNGASALIEALDFFKGRNPYLEAKVTIEHGDRHSLSIQRIRNLQGAIQNPGPVLAKWRRLLYPHFTRDALIRVTAAPGPNDDATLAKEELAKRRPIN